MYLSDYEVDKLLPYIRLARAVVDKAVQDANYLPDLRNVTRFRLRQSEYLDIRKDAHNFLSSKRLENFLCSSDLAELIRKQFNIGQEETHNIDDKWVQQLLSNRVSSLP